MGDRAQVFVRSYGESDASQKGVWLYTHNGGYALAETVQAALQRRLRWDDREYLARIVFQQMLGKDTGEYGYGIGDGVHGDIEHPVLILDCSNKRIGFWSTSNTDPASAQWVPFAQFVEMTKAQVARLYGDEGES